MREVAPDELQVDDFVVVKRELFLLDHDASPSPHRGATRTEYEQTFSLALAGGFVPRIEGFVTRVPEVVVDAADTKLVSCLHIQPIGERAVTWVLPGDAKRIVQHSRSGGRTGFMYGVFQRFFVENASTDQPG